MSEIIPSEQDGYGPTCPKCGTELIIPDVTEYVVRRKIWGGVTGNRESLMKNNGIIIRFQSRENAQAYAGLANSQKMNCNHQATVEEYP